MTILQFRAEIVLWMLLDLLPFFLLLVIFSKIYAGQDSVRGLTLSAVLTFYVITGFLQRITSTHFESWRCEDIRLGRIDFLLIRPFSYLKDIFLGDAVRVVFDILMFLPIFALLVLAAVVIAPLQPLLTSTFTLIQFFSLIVISYLIQVCLSTIIVLLTFWFEGAEGLQHFKWMALNLLSGAFIPRELMPGWLLTITERLPFQYLYLIPTEIIQGRRLLSLSDVMFLTAFMGTLFLSILILWKAGVKKYSASGG